MKNLSSETTWLGIHSCVLIGCLLLCLQTQVSQEETLPLHADIVQGGRLSPTKQLTITHSTWKTAKHNTILYNNMYFYPFLPSICTYIACVSMFVIESSQSLPARVNFFRCNRK